MIFINISSMFANEYEDKEESLAHILPDVNVFFFVLHSSASTHFILNTFLTWTPSFGHDFKS